MQPHTHRFLLWQCTPTTETRGKKKQDAYCMNWSVRRTQRPMRTGKDGRHKMQMICHYCGNRPRKDEATVWVYANREDADAECERRNASHAVLKPNTTVVIGGKEYDDDDTDWTGVIA